ncbi:MAG: cytochrome b N-terminal domain-containing protein [Cytophagaceae bacterium]
MESGSQKILAKPMGKSVGVAALSNDDNILSFIKKIFATKNLPVYNLGRIAMYAFLLASFTGIYLLIFYRIDPLEAYNSTEAISNQFIGGIMRSVHRYSSDLMLLATALHFIKTLSEGKYKLRFSWISGIASLGITVLIAFTGFILVWDQKAKLLGLMSTKLLSSLPLFSPSISGLFIIEDLKSLSGFFRISFVGHFFLSLLLLLIVYLHITKIGKRKFLPTNHVMWGVTIFLVLLSLVFPVRSDEPANISVLPVNTSFDWFYFVGLFPLKFLSFSVTAYIGITILVVALALPYILKFKNDKGAHSKMKDYAYSAAFVVMFLLMPTLSNSKVNFYAADNNLLILNFKYLSSAVEVEQFQTEIAHMKNTVPIVKSRAPISVKVVSQDGNVLFSKNYDPAGMRKNAAIHIYEEVTLKKKVKILLTEKGNEQVDFESEWIDPDKTTVVSFNGGFVLQ